ncbi:hypothetical protein CRBSH125_25090 [Afipia carboxidovorans]|nr:hypothetical protein CRBSH125_25090 [Afipia carboxidovorans]
MKRIVSALATIWRLASPYFRSEDKWAGGVLLATIVAIELVTVAIDVLINQWRNRFFNALQEYNWAAFVHEAIYFFIVGGIFIIIAVYQLYLNQWLQIRWRKWMTERYLGEWLDEATHYRMQLAGDVADNPDQRIAEDVRIFIEQFLTLGLGLLNSVVTLVSFVIILWGLSEAAPLHLFGLSFNIPGYLVWAALIYAIIGTLLTHLIGRPLIGLDFHQQRFEADFRFNLVRTRENSEQIALLKGGDAEHARLSERLGAIIRNWHAIMIRTKKVTAVTQSYGQAAQIFPYVMVAPAYFAHKTQLGGMMQAASAFLSVQGALSFFIGAYRQLAEWLAVIERLEGFERSMAAARARRHGDIRLAPQAARDITLTDLDLDSAGRRTACDSGESDLARTAVHIADRPFRLRQVDAIPRHRRHLAVRPRHHHASGRHDADGAAAAAVFPDRNTRRGDHLPDPPGWIYACRPHRRARRRRPARVGRTAG